jgi:acyl carrier protein
MNQDETRAAVLETAAEILEVEEVSGADNFFDLGGDSLLAMKFVGRLRLAVGTKIPLALLVDQPDFDAFAAAVAQRPGRFARQDDAGNEEIAELRALVTRRPDGRARLG